MKSNNLLGKKNLDISCLTLYDLKPMRIIMLLLLQQVKTSKNASSTEIENYSC